jgi:hypothetical protein
LSTAYANTDVGGEIIALTTAGYGGLTITTAVTIQAVPGEIGFISVVTGTSGLVVNAGASDKVVIRNFQISGLGAANTTGITHNTGKLLIDGCILTQLTTGLRGFAGTIIAQNSSFSGNSTRGVHVSSTAKADLIGILIANNGTGITADGNCANTFVRVDSGSIVNNTLGVEMLNAVCSPTSGSLPPNIFLRGDGGQRVNMIGNTTAVGPSPGMGLQAVAGSYSSITLTNY